MRDSEYSFDIAQNARERVMSLSLGRFDRPKRRDRQALAVGELSDAEIEAIRRAEPPAEAAEYDYELTAGGGSGI